MTTGACICVTTGACIFACKPGWVIVKGRFSPTIRQTNYCVKQLSSQLSLKHLAIVVTAYTQLCAVKCRGHKITQFSLISMGIQTYANVILNGTPCIYFIFECIALNSLGNQGSQLSRHFVAGNKQK